MADAASAPFVAALVLSAAAGAVSFASPCVLPLVPGYLAFASGLSAAGSEQTPAARRATTLAATALFVLGFAVFFTLLGGAFGGLGQELAEHRALVGTVGGVIVLGLGLFLLGVIRPPTLERDVRAFSLVRRGGLLTALPLGIVFAAGWTPCIGPTLGSILTLTAADGGATPARGAALAFGYALGLGTPFLLVALMLDRGTSALRRARRYGVLMQRASGGVLVAIGVLLVTGLWDRLLVSLRPLVTGFTPAL